MGRVGDGPIGGDPQGLALDALEATLQHAAFTGIDQRGKTAFVCAVDGAPHVAGQSTLAAQVYYSTERGRSCWQQGRSGASRSLAVRAFRSRVRTAPMRASATRKCSPPHCAAWWSGSHWAACALRSEEHTSELQA